jgi:hypothetical protein
MCQTIDFLMQKPLISLGTTIVFHMPNN